MASSHVHHYQLNLSWAADASSHTTNYRSYSRDHLIEIDGKAPMQVSADPAFQGNSARHNPEEYLVAALSSCHMLTFLSLAARRGLLVRSYQDRASGEMIQDGHGGRFSQVTLRPLVVLEPGQDPAPVNELHHQANRDCFIACSMNFPVHHEPETRVAES